MAMIPHTNLFPVIRIVIFFAYRWVSPLAFDVGERLAGSGGFTVAHTGGKKKKKRYASGP
jgi:hypothetical protein